MLRRESEESSENSAEHFSVLVVFVAFSSITFFEIEFLLATVSFLSRGLVYVVTLLTHPGAFLGVVTAKGFWLVVMILGLFNCFYWTGFLSSELF